MNYQEEYNKLAAAIRNHRDQRGDDRCWKDDCVLYKSLPEGYVIPEREVAVELEYCKKYLECRQNPDTVYISPQRRIEELEKLVEDLEEDLLLSDQTHYE